MNSWKRRVDLNFLFYLISIIVFVSLNFYYNITTIIKNTNKEHFNITQINENNETLSESPEIDYGKIIFKDFALPGIYMQLTASHLQLVVIIGKCLNLKRCTGSSMYFGRMKTVKFLTLYAP